MAEKPISGSHLSSDRGPLTCVHCGRPGHEKASCYKIIGYPDWLKEKLAARERNKAARAQQRGSQAAHTVQSVAAPSSSAVSVTDADRAAFGPALNNDQWTAVINMFSAMQSQSSKSGNQFEDGDWRG